MMQVVQESKGVVEEYNQMQARIKKLNTDRQQAL